MKKNIKISRYLVLALLIVTSICGKAQEWQYVDPLHPTELFGIKNNPASFGIDDLYNEAFICGAEDKFICIKARDFELYIPKNLKKAKEGWVVNGIKYKAQLIEYYSLLGVVGDVYFIDQISNKHSLRFIYSKERGLLAMGGTSSDKSRLFLLTRQCGFGALSHCKETHN